MSQSVSDSQSVSERTGMKSDKQISFIRLINRIKSNGSKLKVTASTKMNQIKRRLTDKIKNFRQELDQAKHISKQEAFLFGMCLGFGALSLIYLAKRYPAFAKDKLNNGSKPGGPTQTPAPPAAPAQAPNGITLSDKMIKIYGEGFVYGFFFLGKYAV